jgi:hypothetical protein
MKKLLIAVAVATTLVGCGKISTGTVGLQTEFNGTLNPEPLPPGIYGAVFSHIDDYMAKEIEVKFDGLTPKGKDNLILADFDVSVWYQPTPGMIPQLVIKYAGMHPADNEGKLYPAFNLVDRVARGVIFDVVSKYDSLTIHTKRGVLEAEIQTALQKELDSNTIKGAFTITRAVVRQIKTDPQLDASIQRNVQMQKDIQSKQQEVELAKAEAARYIAEAEGTAKHNALISASLTPLMVEYKKALAMQECGSRAGCTMIVGTSATPIINLK